MGCLKSEMTTLTETGRRVILYRVSDCKGVAMCLRIRESK